MAHTKRKAALAAPKDIQEPEDGRHQRATQSRKKIIEAMLALFSDGNFTPSAEDVADRAGVGRRTVFRLFKDMESLYGEIHAVMLARVEVILKVPIEGMTWQERLNGLIERRVQFFEEVLPVKTAADIHRYRSPFLTTEHVRTAALLRDVLLFVLPKSVSEDPTRFEALDMILSVEAWRRLRLDQKLSVKAAKAVLKHAVERLVGAA
jgi:AcrR family transcriptional regulator